MKKGVIMDVDDHYVTFLTHDGQFLKALKEEKMYTIGEEMLFVPCRAAEKKSKKYSFSFRKTAMAGIAVAIILLFSLMPKVMNQEVSAYMTIDINPSIELELDNNLQVVKMSGINSEGKTVVKQIIGLKETDIKSVTKQIMGKVQELGYFEEDHDIIFSTALVKDNHKLDVELKAELEGVTLIKSLPDTNVKIVKATVDDREKAKEIGVSTGVYVDNQMKDKINVDEKKPAQTEVEEVLMKQEKQKLEQPSSIKSIPKKSVPEPKITEVQKDTVDNKEVIVSEKRFIEKNKRPAEATNEKTKVGKERQPREKVYKKSKIDEQRKNEMARQKKTEKSKKQHTEKERNQKKQQNQRNNYQHPNQRNNHQHPNQKIERKQIENEERHMKGHREKKGRENNGEGR